jgi:hypothetical protein
MRERNPFLIRTAERISNEDEFIKLFSPKIIDIIRDNIEGYSLWNQFFRFQSSPGGGKTSLLKLFSPSILFRLQQIFKSRIDSNPDIDSLYKNLKLLDAYTDKDELNVLTLYISCASDYDNISNLNISESKKNRLFVSLMNSRILIAFVRTFLDFLKIKKPDSDFKAELRKLKIKPNSALNIPSDFPINCNALDLYNWSGKLENIIYREIDGLKNNDDIIREHSGLFSAQLLTSSQLSYEGDGFPTNFAILFDDAQKLALEQYNFLSNEIIEKRPSNGIWFAERLDLFSLDELWSKDASTGGRDYVKEINLEELLRGKSKFKEFSINVAEKRVERSKDVSLNSFPSTLLNEVNISEDKINELITEVQNKISRISQNKLTYINLLNFIDNRKYDNKFDKLCELRIAQIIIERKEKKESKEPSLFENEYLTDEFEIEKKKFSRNNSNYLLSRDYNIPFYFGYDNLVGLSSSNIEQFLAFSGRLFENIISAKTLGNDSRISSQEQERILLKEVDRRWKDLNSLSNSNQVKSLLDSIAKFCSSQDNIPGFPYRGATGFALSLDDRKRLTDPKFWQNNPHYEVIARTLTVAIANNLIEVSIDRKQGIKGDPPKTLFFLNRWICLKYNLSFGYSGWRKVNLDTIGKWIKRGYKEEDTNIIEISTKNLYD